MYGSRHSIAVVDKHPIILQGVKALISTQEDLEIPVAATTSAAVLELPENVVIDLVLIDLPQVETDAVGFVERIKTRYAGIKILIYTNLEDDRYLSCMARVGVAGCLLKTSPSLKLLEAVRCVLEGGLYYPQDILPHYRRNSNAQAVRVGPAVEQLSRREQEVFRMMRDGAGSAVISARLQISRSTVNAHLTNIKKKLGASSFRELYRLAYCFSDRNDTERIGA